MPNGTGSFKLPWFCVFFWVLLLPCLDITLAQDLAGIARSARAQAEREVRRRNAVSRVRSMTTRPSVTFIPRKYHCTCLSVCLSLSLSVSLSLSRSLYIRMCVIVCLCARLCVCVCVCVCVSGSADGKAN